MGYYGKKGKFLCLMAGVAICILTPLTSRGHSGGVDSQGCHTNKKSGEYHCHGSGSGTKQPGYNNTGGGYNSIQIVPTPTPKRNQNTVKTAVLNGGASVVSVGDGDTIRVTGQNGQKATIRLACIDAPETAQGESGKDAKETLVMLLGNGNVEIRPVDVDRYGRTVAEVFSNGTNVNLEMVRSGRAYVYRDYLDKCDENAYLNAEANAERRRLGVWYWGNEQKPWDFRKGK